MTRICVFLIVLVAGIGQLDALSLRKYQTQRPEYCSTLFNEESHFTVAVGVGTPRTPMRIVADTGSSGVIVGSCRCKNRTSKTCFRGRPGSTSFVAPRGDWQNNAIHHHFGSGDITTTPVQEIVEVGGVNATMTSMLLMVESAIHIPDFQGILGLGLPAKSSGDKWLAKRQSFMEAAGVKSFSICFTGENSPGVLRFDPPAAPKMLQNMGLFHWGLAFNGFSVGSKSTPAVVCSKDTMKKGQDTPCGAIPDSGSTDIMGPPAQVKTLKGDICERWPRCKKQVMAGLDGKDVDCEHVAKTSTKGTTKEECETSLSDLKAAVFNHLMGTCSKWLSEGGLKEVPSLFIHLQGHDQEEDVLELTSWAWMTRTSTFGATTCSPMFGDYEMNTEKNGPIWVLGTPLFHEYQVVFGMNPLAIGFNNEKCKSCAEDAVSSALPSPLLNFHSSSSLSGQRVGRDVPRVMDKPRLLPNYDASEPF